MSHEELVKRIDYMNGIVFPSIMMSRPITECCRYKTARSKNFGLDFY
jgi:hypothetical protein